MPNNFYIQYKDGCIQTLKGNDLDEPVVKHSFRLFNNRIKISGKVYSVVNSVLKRLSEG